MKILITGSRLWRSYSYILRSLKRWKGRLEASQQPLTILHGACPRGADYFADIAVQTLGIAVERYPAYWDAFGKKAGMKRNREMLDQKPDLVIGFLYTRDEEALHHSGTLDCLQEADKRGIPWELHTE